MIRRYFESYIENLKSTLDEIDFKQVDAIIQCLWDAREEDKQVFILGNGGSASTASHFACDLAKGTIDLKNANFRRFRAMSLTDNIALITAIGNDISYEDIFVEQLKNHLNPKDVVIVITSSGNSPNVLRAIEYASKRGATTIGLLGFNGGKAKDLVNISMVVSSRNCGISEDFHMIIVHILTQIIRRILEEKRYKVGFLDRDGVINQRARPHEYITRWEDFKFVPGAIEALKEFSHLGYKLVVITNQQSVGKGILSESRLDEIHEKMLGELARQGIDVERVFVCPHREEDGCFCRKPKPGLFYRALSELSYHVDLEKSFFLGDSETDILAGNHFGIRTFYLNHSNKKLKDAHPDAVISDLSEMKLILETIR